MVSSVYCSIKRENFSSILCWIYEPLCWFLLKSSVLHSVWCELGAGHSDTLWRKGTQQEGKVLWPSSEPTVTCCNNKECTVISSDDACRPREVKYRNGSSLLRPWSASSPDCEWIKAQLVSISSLCRRASLFIPSLGLCQSNTNCWCQTHFREAALCFWKQILQRNCWPGAFYLRGRVLSSLEGKDMQIFIFFIFFCFKMQRCAVRPLL